MPDFHWTESASISPTMCFLCANHEGPFIDTGVENERIGRIYICASKGNRIGCVRQMGRLDGLYEPYSIDEINSRLEAALDNALPAMNRIMEENLAQALADTERLQALVEELAKSKLVPALEVFELGRAARD
jgi:hypothetical protein